MNNPKVPTSHEYRAGNNALSSTSTQSYNITSYNGNKMFHVIFQVESSKGIGARFGGCRRDTEEEQEQEVLELLVSCILS